MAVWVPLLMAKLFLSFNSLIELAGITMRERGVG